MKVFKVTIILTLLTIKTIACTCNDRINKRKLIRNSDFAFYGVVTENVYKDEYEAMMFKERGVQADAKVKITKLIKGVASANNVIVISSGSGECDINFIPGKKYLIIGNYKRKEIESVFDPSLLPPDSLIQMTPTFNDKETTQPNTKTRDEWLTELGETNKLIFTTVCMSFYIKED